MSLRVSLFADVGGAGSQSALASADQLRRTLAGLALYIKNVPQSEGTAASASLLTSLDLISQSPKSPEASQLFMEFIEKRLSAFAADSNLSMLRFEQLVAYHLLLALQKLPKQLTISTSLVLILESIAKNSELRNAAPYLTNNVVWTLGIVLSRSTLGKFSPKVETISESLWRLERYFPLGSEPYVWVVSALTLERDCVRKGARKLCKSGIQAKYQSRLFPQAFAFSRNQHSILVHTALSRERVTGIVDQLEDVFTRFQNTVRIKEPLQGDSNRKLTIYLYQSEADYKAYHRFLFGLGSSAGGIYIEQSGTLYSYERTARQSIYSLNDLVRHEYVHYLVGRYLVPGMWGDEELYGNRRLTWFDEGMAEFISGASEPGHKIKMRRSLIRLLKADTARPTLASVLNFAESNREKNYRYAGALVSYLATDQPKIFHSLISALRVGKAKGFDKIVQRLNRGSNFNFGLSKHIAEITRETLL